MSDIINAYTIKELTNTKTEGGPQFLIRTANNKMAALIKELPDGSIEITRSYPGSEKIESERIFILPRETTKRDSYDRAGILQNMDIGDWIVTKNDEVRVITMHDMPDLKGEDIARFATLEEIAQQNPQE